MMSQTEARQLAKTLQGRGMPVIAGAVPLGSWGGTEKGWGIYTLSENGRLIPADDLVIAHSHSRKDQPA